MTEYSVADAKKRRPKLIDKALAGEEVVITRCGKPVVELRPASAKPKPPIGSDEWLFERTRARPRVGLTSVQILDLLYEADEDEHLFGHSVLIPALVKEAATDAVEAYLAIGQERVISDFAALEVASVLSRFVRTSHLAAADAAARLVDFESWRAASSPPADVHAADVGLAYTYLRRFELMLRAPEALHLAIARRRDATLVGLDRRLADAARELGVSVTVPGTDSAANPR